MAVVPYDPARHHGACLALFDSNVGGTFRAEERADFAAFLNALPGPYRVLIGGSGVVACGGLAREAEAGLVAVCWTMVDRHRQGEGLGRRLHEALLDEARAGGARAARLETIPETSGFFARLGFEVVFEDPDGYGPGLPLVEMRARL